MSIVPATGMNVRKEGCVILSLNETMLTISMTNPSKGIHFPIRRQTGGNASRLTKTSTPPNSNSQARVGRK